jgi:hypothetical protein
MWDWIGKLDELKRLGREAVLVTVTRYSGSTPRKTGAKMIVLADGIIFGTVGGGGRAPCSRGGNEASAERGVGNDGDIPETVG